MKEKIRGNEYRLTRICVDKYNNRVPVGRLYNPFCPEGMQFTSLMELIIEMENLLDEMQFPQPFTSRRSFGEAPTAWLGVVGTSSQEMGLCATFQVRILFRQNASWQGSVLWCENGVEESFRSVLELILLMNGALWQSMKAGLAEDKDIEPEEKRNVSRTKSLLTRKDYWNILYASKRNGRKKTYLMIKTIVNAGLLHEELKQLTVELLEQGQAWLTTRKRKRLVIIPEPLRSELLAYAKEEGIQEGLIFRSRNGAMSHTHIWADVKRACLEAGIPEEKGNPSALYKLYRATYQDICREDAEHAQQRYQALLEEEERHVFWDNPAQ